MDVAVVGAGVAGLAAALAFARRGARVTVYEQASAIAEVGAGLQIGPNGARVLRALGLGAAFDRLGVAAQAVALCDGLTGRAVLRMDLAAYAGDWRLLHRADLVGMLLEGAVAAGVTVRTGIRVERPEDVAADLVVGADGLHSVLHRALNGRVAPFFTHQCAWRALVPGDGGGAVAEVHMAPGRHVVSYPLRGGALRNIVAVEERRDWTEEGWSQVGDPAAMRAAFAGFSARVQGWMADVDQCGLWGLFRHPVAPVWHKGTVAIIGDAAHPTLPFLAQGAALGLEDAWTLAAAVMNGGLAALPAWQAARRPRAVRVVDAATANARVYHIRAPLRGPVYAAMRVGAMVAPGAALRRFDWLYRHDVTDGAQIS
jgi:salicylate hydroxylase